MKYIVFLSILLASFSIIGCKEKRVRYFQYEIVNNESICSLKPKEIFESKEGRVKLEVRHKPPN